MGPYCSWSSAMEEKQLIDILWVLIAAGFVFMMQGGFLCLESGLTRSKNSINVAIKNLADFGIAVVLYWIFGFALMFGITNGGWVGTTHFYPNIGQGEAWLATFFLFQVMFCATAATIVSGAIAERIRFKAYIIITIVISGLIYPLFGHWAWGGAYVGASGPDNIVEVGWLAERGFIDFAGSSVVHSVGGWVALAILLIIGPRTGRFPEGQLPQKIQGNNLPMAMLGVILLFFGWFGFNGGSTLVLNDRVPGIIANTALAGASGMVVTLFVGWFFRKLPDASLPMNGALAGLVAITANCHAVNTSSAVIIGAIGGMIMLVARNLLERFQIDDVIGAVPVHLAAGVWGTLAVALFGNLEILETGLTRIALLKVQVIGIMVCFFFAFGVSYFIFRIINRFFPLRVTPQDECDGLNVAEHGVTTELIDLLGAMEIHEKTQDLSIRVPEEPFTEVGHIAKRYNRLMSALQETMGNFKLIIDHSTDAIIQINSKGSITLWSPSAARVFGWSSQEALGQTLSKLIIPQQYREAHIKGMKRLAETGEGPILNKPLELSALRRDGSEFPIEMIVFPIQVENECLFGSVIRDITGRKKTEKLIQRKGELEEITKKLQEKTNRLNRFQNLLVGREHDMIKLKQEINELLQKLGQPKKFQSLREFKKEKELKRG